MNIFALSSNPRRAAEFMCDKHVVKMILESAQMLSTAHRVLDKNESEILYKKTHINHPCVKWVMESNKNYNWLYCHFHGLCEEYTFRYGKSHKTWNKLGFILFRPPVNIPQKSFIKHPQAMPDEFKTENSIEAYQRYYRYKETQIDMKWSKRERPWFMN